MAKRKYDNCPNCDRERPDFAISKDTNDCDKCRPEKDRASQTFAKANNTGVDRTQDVIALAKRRLAKSDWTQMSDARPNKKLSYIPYRERLREIIDEAEAGDYKTAAPTWPEEPSSVTPTKT